MGSGEGCAEGARLRKGRLGCARNPGLKGFTGGTPVVPGSPFDCGGKNGGQKPRQGFAGGTPVELVGSPSAEGCDGKKGCQGPCRGFA